MSLKSSQRTFGEKALPPVNNGMFTVVINSNGRITGHRQHTIGIVSRNNQSLASHQFANSRRTEQADIVVPNGQSGGSGSVSNLNVSAVRV